MNRSLLPLLEREAIALLHAAEGDVAVAVSAVRVAADDRRRAARDAARN